LVYPWYEKYPLKELETGAKLIKSKRKSFSEPTISKGFAQNLSERSLVLELAILMQYLKISFSKIF